MYKKIIMSTLLGFSAAAALVVTFFTFLPSFAFILLGGPFIESTHGKLGFTAPLSAITAAVVGVILNLALFFAYHVLWPQGFDGAFDTGSAVIAVAVVPVAVVLAAGAAVAWPFAPGPGVVAAAVQAVKRCVGHGGFFTVEEDEFDAACDGGVGGEQTS